MQGLAAYVQLVRNAIFEKKFLLQSPKKLSSKIEGKYFVKILY
jgi:hypothetical protein